MMRFLYLLLLLVIIVFGVSFAVENKDPVTFHYFVGSVEVALAWLLALTLVLGALLGMLASVGVILRLRRELRAQKRRLTEQAAPPPREPHAQATRVQESPVQDPHAPEPDAARREEGS